MKKNHFLLIVSVLILLSAIILQIKQTSDKKSKERNSVIIENSLSDDENNINRDNLVGSYRDEHGCIPSAGYTWCEPKAKCLRIWEEDCVLEIEDESSLNKEGQNTKPILSSPLANEIVTSPLEIKGEARGTWFFEANLPLKLIDGDDNVIAEGYGTAQTEWMSEDYVPFTASISFETEENLIYLLIEKSNPSGLLEYDDQIIIPLNL